MQTWQTERDLYNKWLFKQLRRYQTAAAFIQETWSALQINEQKQQLQTVKEKNSCCAHPSVWEKGGKQLSYCVQVTERFWYRRVFVYSCLSMICWHIFRFPSQTTAGCMIVDSLQIEICSYFSDACIWTSSLHGQLLLQERKGRHRLLSPFRWSSYYCSQLTIYLLSRERLILV